MQSSKGDPWGIDCIPINAVIAFAEDHKVHAIKIFTNTPQRIFLCAVWHAQQQ